MYTQATFALAINTLATYIQPTNLATDALASNAQAGYKCASYQHTCPALSPISSSPQFYIINQLRHGCLLKKGLYFLRHPAPSPIMTSNFMASCGQRVSLGQRGWLNLNQIPKFLPGA